MSSKLKVQELRQELEKRGLDTTGLKPALVSRLDEAINSESQTENAAAKDEDAPAKPDKAVAKDETASTAIDKNDNKANGTKKIHPRDEDTDAPVKRMKVEDVKKLSVDELKSALTSFDRSTVGSKASLKKRLISALAALDADGGPSDGEKVEDIGEKMVTATKKGRAVLDPNLPEHIKSVYHVFEEGDVIYDAMLNQTNVGGNNNKYYVIQALENDARTLYQLFTRWGRVGVPGQTKLATCANKDQVRAQFLNTFRSKTSNHWSDRHTFTSYPGKYTWLEMDYDAEEKTEEVDEGSGKSIAKTPKEVAPSKLPPQVQKLISLICDVNMMNQQMTEIGYDARKMPLGKLSKSTILKGYDVLKRIAVVLETTKNRSELEQLSSEFYTVIPHDFGFKKMRDFIIDTAIAVKKKLDMVEALGEIELASKILGVKRDEEDPLYCHYQNLKCELEYVDMESDAAAWIKAYAENTQGATHHFTIDVQQIFKVMRDGEDNRFQPFTGVKNRMLLWHGSKLCNWTGILSQGLRIAPPEAPVSGYMFGKGVYFADMVSKSANYCTPSADGTSLILLCEVALGDMRELLHSDYNASNLPKGKLSTKGVGATAPDSKGYKVLPDGVVVPMGKAKQTKLDGAGLFYNEFIVYDTAQIRMKYLMTFKRGTKRQH